MNKEKKNTSTKFKFITNKVAQAVVALGAIATTQACTIWLHEKKVPNELLKNNPFTEKE